MPNDGFVDKYGFTLLNSEMENKIYWLKYLSPFIGMLFCPVTILFMWTIWSGPIVNSEIDVTEEVIP